MVIHFCHSAKRPHGSLMIELATAMALLVIALLPLAYSIGSEKRMARSLYQRSVAMEIVDGELEVLQAGEWHLFKPGTCEYPVQAGAVTNLPPGRFWLTVAAGKVRLEWRPEVIHQGGSVVREVEVQ